MSMDPTRVRSLFLLVHLMGCDIQVFFSIHNNVKNVLHGSGTGSRIIFHHLRIHEIDDLTFPYVDNLWSEGFYDSPALLGVQVLILPVPPCLGTHGSNLTSNGTKQSRLVGEHHQCGGESMG